MKELKIQGRHSSPRPRVLVPTTCQHGTISANSARTFFTPADIVKRVTTENWFKQIKSAVELGSGCLRNSRFLLENGIKVAVWETPQVILKYKEEYEEFEKMGGMVIDKIKPAEYDLAIITFVLETICPDFARSALLHDAHLMLKAAGWLVLGIRSTHDVKTAEAKGIYCRIGGGYRTPIKTFIRPYNLRSLSKILSVTQFRIERVYSQSPILNVVARSI